MRSMFQPAVLSLTLLLGACATQAPISKAPQPVAVQPQPVIEAPAPTAEEQALRSVAALQDRMYRVAAPLLISNTELCKGNARNLLGFTAKNKYSFSADFVDAAQSAFGLDEPLQVTGVLAGSGALKAGVRRGDRLVAVESNLLPEGQNAERQAATILAPLVSGRTSVTLTVKRNGSNLTLDVPLTHACAFNIEPGNADNVNAYADGHRVLLTRGMLNFVQNDEELAYVLAKEMAANALALPQKQRISATAGGIIDNLIRMHPDLSTMSGTSGIKAMPQELDAAADTLALYMVARAGYGIDNAPAFWQKLSSQYPVTVLNGYTAIHPGTPYRLAAMDKAIAEIKKKQAVQKALLP